MSQPIRIEIRDSLSGVDPEAWNALGDPDNPFLDHAFLHALELSRSTSAEAECIPFFHLAWKGRDLVAAVPSYLKSGSSGEYIFDWNWAQGAIRAGINYFPKLVVFVPFTPVTGPRLLRLPDQNAAELLPLFERSLNKLAEDTRASSIHWLYPPASEMAGLTAAGYLPRLNHQYHWINRNYRSFDDWLAALRSPVRKMVRKERRIVMESGLKIETLSGAELQPHQWKALHQFYISTHRKMGGYTYLRPEFFDLLPGMLANRVAACIASRDGVPIAGALNFEKGKGVYGRYWGCIEEHNSMHFELCYYQLIERAIRNGCERVEAGAQGEHKFKRGYDAQFIHSAHRFLHPGLHRAIEGYLQREREWATQQMEVFRAHTAYKRIAGNVQESEAE
ncbi:MAG: hypothetical protein GMKNLPBB_02076 [Myxococcota bacterium]|nr:hypothetical protein [Myxococcota bacterium]